MKLIRDWNEHAAPTSPEADHADARVSMRDLLRAGAVIVLIAAGIVALVVTGVLPPTAAPEMMIIPG
jgi:hypothetical protein